MIVRKLRLQHGWTQSQVAEMADVTVRTIQRVERGHKPSLETCKALASVFEVEFSTFYVEDQDMNHENDVTGDEQEAMLHAKGKKAFYEQLGMYLLFALIFLPVFHGEPVVYFVFGGMGIGIFFQGLVVFEVISFLSPGWEKRLVEKRLGRKL